MRIFKSKLVFIISLVGLSSSSAMVWSTIQNNKKYGELYKKINNHFFDIFENYNNNYKEWRFTYDGQEEIDKAIKSNIRDLLQEYVYSDFSLFEKKLNILVLKT